MREELAGAKRVVVKIGSSLLTNAGAGLDREAVADWAGQIAALRARGVEVLVVSSGAIAEGMKRLAWTKRPSAVNELQAAAAVGQMGLVQMWESCFAERGLRTAKMAERGSPDQLYLVSGVARANRTLVVEVVAKTD